MRRSKHSLSHYKLLTMKMGQLVPIAWFEALPGDTIQQATSALVRCAPLVTPVMHPVNVRIHHWFVPNRIIWDHWENFITGGPDGMDATAHPYLQTGSVPVSSLSDYLGVPTTALGSTRLSALPYRAYAMIWNEYYRDEDLQTPVVVSTADGLDSTTSVALQQCSWEKDYLTSSRPWEVKGPSITLPLGTSAPVNRVSNAANAWQMFNLGNNTAQGAATVTTNASGLLQSVALGSLDPRGGLIADLSSATAVTINTLRKALASQRFEEARARYGSRYTEYLRYLGVRSSDARLQRPEYLGGGKQTIQFSEVLQTGPGTDPVATMKGHGIAAMRSNRYRRFFEEHGIVMSLLSVRPRTMYTQRTKRAWLRGNPGTGLTADKNDYWQVEMQHIGQQQVNGIEVDSQLTAAGAGFGYQDRYDEYRREESSIAGLFRTTLNNWHLARDFGAPPALNSTFVSCVPTQRVFADTSADNLYIMANHSIQARRLVAQTGTSMTF